ncbi:unnamed protein product [Caenorhabditis auriculariae]|uniref:Proline dehydrogenase 1, mitochondrial n=1 Tax=Caenorhabditis auriculariae TaxID=2777116 RepID=A0A8S1H4V9_9PELO|nr:unnamed protein product [Caenorhabditis auriculariae]
MRTAFVSSRRAAFILHKTASGLPVSAYNGFATSSVVSKASESPPPGLAKEIEQCYSRLDLSFENTKEAFKSKTNSELIRALVVLRLCSVGWLVQKNQAILATLRNVLGSTLFKKVLKSTFYGHFVAGETKTEVEPVVSKLRRFGVKSILDYSVEADISSEEATKRTVKGTSDAKIETAAMTEIVDPATAETTRERYSVHKEFADRREGVASARTYFYEGEEVCDQNRDIFRDSIDAVAAVTGGEGFCAVKITALGRPQLLLKLSESIAQTQNFFRALTQVNKIQVARLTEQDFINRLKELGVKTDSQSARKWFRTVDFDSDGEVDFHGWNKLLDDNTKLGQLFKVLNINTGELEPLIQNLSNEEELEFRNMVRRTLNVAEYAISKGVRIMVDAEQTYLQPAISRITIEMMKRYNKERGNIFNTYQAYLKSALQNMEADMQVARREGWHFGAKLVRGAYMEQERKRAETVGYADPINVNYEMTSKMYESCLTRIGDEIERRGRNNVSVMIASHNEDTVRFAVNLMKERTIAPSERLMCFAQLYGMCDQVSFSLGQAGYSVYKYLPYGPVEDVLPYLSRRALENGSVLKKANKERSSSSFGIESRLVIHHERSLELHARSFSFLAVITGLPPPEENIFCRADDVKMLVECFGSRPDLPQRINESPRSLAAHNRSRPSVCRVFDLKLPPSRASLWIARFVGNERRISREWAAGCRAFGSAIDMRRREDVISRARFCLNASDPHTINVTEIRRILVLGEFIGYLARQDLLEAAAGHPPLSPTQLGGSFQLLPETRARADGAMWMMKAALAVLVAVDVVASRRLPDVFWNSTNTIFDVSNTDHVMSVLIGDRLTIRCPRPDNLRPYEYSYIFMVSEEEYSHCFLKEPRLVGACDNETNEISMNIVFRQFTPTPGGFEFEPGHTYYLTSTSDGSQKGIGRRKGGLCETHQMKVKFDVFAQDGGRPKFAARINRKDEETSSTPVMYVIHNDEEDDDDNAAATTTMLAALLVAEKNTSKRKEVVKFFCIISRSTFCAMEVVEEPMVKPLARPKKSRWPSVSLSLCSLIVAVGGAFNFGFQLLITNPAQEAFIQFLNASRSLRDDGTDNLKDLENEWSSIVATFFLGSFCGAFLIRLVSERLGRKKGLILSHAIQAFGCLLTILSYFTVNHYVFVVSRIIIGIGITISMGISAMFITECSPCECRGVTSLANGTMLQCGLVVGAVAAMPQLLGTTERWFWLFVIELFGLVGVLSAMPFVKESPGHLLAHNRNSEAISSVQFYYNVTQSRARKIVDDMSSLKSGQKESLVSVWKDPWTRRGTLIGCFVMWSMAMSGITVINAFAFEILVNTGLNPFEASLANVFVCLFSVLGILMSTTIIESHGRRPLLLSTFACLAVINVAVFGLMFAFGRTKVPSVGLALVAAICVFNFVFAMGPGPLSLFISGELVGQNARSASATWANATMAATRSVLLAVYIPFKNATSESTAYIAFFLFPMVFAVFVLYFTLPETKGKTVEELREKALSRRLLK